MKPPRSDDPLRGFSFPHIYESADELWLRRTMRMTMTGRTGNAAARWFLAAEATGHR
jgi:hypothetical protein